MSSEDLSAKILSKVTEITFDSDGGSITTDNPKVEEAIATVLFAGAAALAVGGIAWAWNKVAGD